MVFILDEEPLAEGAADSYRDKGRQIQLYEELPGSYYSSYDREALQKASPINPFGPPASTASSRGCRMEGTLFTEAEKFYENKFDKEQQKGFPKCIIRGMYFAKSEPALQAASEAGDVYVIKTIKTEEGKEFYASQQVTAGTEVASNVCCHCCCCCCCCWG